MATTIGDGILRQDILVGYPLKYCDPREVTVANLRFDGRDADTKVWDASRLANLGAGGAEISIRADQFTPDQIAGIAANCNRGGGALHVLDVGERDETGKEKVSASSAMSMMRGGAHWYYHNGLRRPFGNVLSITQAADNGGYFFYYLYDTQGVDVNDLVGVQRSQGDVEIRAYLDPTSVNTVLRSGPSHERRGYLGDGIWYLSGTDSSKYPGAVLQLIARNQYLDGRFETARRNHLDFYSAGNRGCHLILKTNQYNPEQLEELAGACKDGGGMLHLIDTGELSLDQISGIGQTGAYLYYHDGTSRRRHPEELGALAEAFARGRGKFIYFDYDGSRVDLSTLQNIVASGGAVEFRARRPFSHIQTVQS